MEKLSSLINQEVVVVAEIGINHNGDFELAKELIDAAADCGVQAVKFQSYKTEYMYSRLTPAFSHTDNDVFAQLKNLEIQDDWWIDLKKRANQKGLLFSASIFDDVSLHVIHKIGVDFVKVASGEIDNLSFLKRQISLSDQFVVSTGMALLEEIAVTVAYLRALDLNDIVLLECTSSYPAKPDSIHLLNIDFLRNTFSCPVGFSDHTEGIHQALAAVARGARLIEKHFTLDKEMAGPDHLLSADINEMKTLVGNIRDVEQGLKSNGKKRVSEHEMESRRLGRKSLTASKNIQKGETIERSNTCLKRPGLGIPPSQSEYIFGKIANQDIAEDQWITWQMVR